MTWRQRTQPIAVGDIVQVSENWLRFTSTFTGNIPRAKGKVLSLKPVGEIMLAEVEWDLPDVSEKMLVSNLQRVRGHTR